MKGDLDYLKKNLKPLNSQSTSGWGLMYDDEHGNNIDIQIAIKYLLDKEMARVKVYS